MQLVPLFEANTDVITLAKEFSSILKEWLSKKEMEELIQANKDERDSSICHSHDYCDPNQAMADAFKKVTGKEVDMQKDKDSALVDAAWDLAKKENFYY